MKVNNLPEYAKDKQFIVVRVVNGEAWFYGAWDDMSKAINQTAEVRGKLLTADEVEG